MTQKQFKCDCGHMSATPKYCADCEKTFCQHCYDAGHPAVKLDVNGRPLVAELRGAFIWDCEECGRENVLRVVVRDYPNKESVPASARDDAMAEFGVDCWEDVPDNVKGQAFSLPNVTQCAFCQENFVVRLPGTVEPDFDEDHDGDEPRFHHG